jgi:hypothetical protein
MKTLEWLGFLREQRAKHGKLVFTVSELANAAQTSPRVLNVELSRLLKRGLIRRYAQGRYGAVGGVAPEDLLPLIDSSAYLTGFYALHRHNIVTQVPSELTCFTRRRHNRSRERLSPLGRFVFVCVSPGIYARPNQGLMAAPEQAFCDFFYLTRRQSLDAQALVTFRNLGRLNGPRLDRILARYPKTVAEAVRRLLHPGTTE